MLLSACLAVVDPLYFVKSRVDADVYHGISVHYMLHSAEKPHENDDSILRQKYKVLVK